MGKLANTIVVIDDEPQIRRFIKAGLELHGYSVRVAANASTGLEAAQSRPDLIILDLGLPDMSGLELLNTVRSWSNVPVIVLSVQVEEEQKVQLLRSGADDYVVKPFGIAELAARCEAALRRCHKAVGQDPVVQTGPLKVNFVSRAVTLDGRDIALMPQEYRVLHLLASRLGLLISYEQLMNDVWGHLSPKKLQYLRMLVRRLRQKLEVDPSQPKLLISESGVGYRLERHRPVDR